MEQLVWSPDGRALVGTANGLGEYWNIGVLDAARRARSRPPAKPSDTIARPTGCPTRGASIYSRGTIPEKNERAQLWVAAPDGQGRHMLYAEAGRHIYGGAASPDGRYLMFSRSVEDLGKVDHAKTTIAMIRLADTPMLGDDDEALRKAYPNARRGVRLDLGPGWEPHWTAADISSTK